MIGYGTLTPYVVSDMGKVETIVDDWRGRKANLRCKEICAGLIHLGFTIRDGRRGGHKIVSHSGLKEFMGTDFDGGHGANELVKPRYVDKLLRVIKDWADDLERL